MLYPKSGTVGNRITYTSYGEGDKPLISRFYAQNNSFINVEDLEFSASSGIPVTIYMSNHIRFEDCEVYQKSGNTSYFTFWLTINATYNEIINCKIYNLSSNGDAINLRRNSNYNLIEGNIIGRAPHYSLSLEGGMILIRLLPVITM